MTILHVFSELFLNLYLPLGMFFESEATRRLELCTSVGFIPVRKLKPRKAEGHAQGCSTGLWPSWTQVLPLHPYVLRLRPAKSRHRGQAALAE